MIKKRSPRWLVAGVTVISALLIPSTFGGAVSAQTQDGGQPYVYVLTNETPTSGALPGSEAGSFDYYRINYPGNATDVRIRVNFDPYDPSVAPALGFHVYGPYGREDSGDWKQEGYLEVTYQEEEPAGLLVQVYNYSAGAASYSIVVTGLPREGITLAPEPEPVQAGPAAEPDGDVEVRLGEGVSGVVVGSHGGAFGRHVIRYAGNEEDVTVSVAFWPADPSFANAFGLNIYDPNGDRVATGASTDDLAVREATFASAVAGTYLVQVYNYADGAALNYALQVTR